jgi:hypothetical protein
MEKYRQGLKNLAYIFLDSIGWEAYFEAVVSSLDITPIEDQLQAQGVPVKFYLGKGYNIESPVLSGTSVIYHIVVDGGATVRLPEDGLPKPPGYLTSPYSMSFKSLLSDPANLKSVTFIKDLWVAVDFINATEAAVACGSFSYSKGDWKLPITFEVIDKPTGFVYSSLKRKYFEYFTHIEKLNHTPSLNGLKRLLHGVGVPIMFGETPKPGLTPPQTEVVQFSRNHLSLDEDLLKRNIKLSTKPTRWCNVLQNVISFNGYDPRTPQSLLYNYVNMKELNVIRGDWHLVQPRETPEKQYIIQGADKDLLMFDPNDNELDNITVITINRDNNGPGADSGKPDPDVGGTSGGDYSTGSPNPEDWSTYPDYTINNPPPPTDRNQEYETAATPTEGRAGGNTQPGSPNLRSSTPYEVDKRDDHDPIDREKTLTLEMTSTDTWETLINDSDPSLDWKRINDDEAYAGGPKDPSDEWYNDKNYVYPPKRRITKLTNVDGEIYTDYRERIVIASRSGVLGSGRVFRGRFILQEYLDPTDGDRAVEGIAWKGISLNLNPPGEGDNQVSGVKELTEEQQTFINWYLKEYANWKIVSKQ